MLTRDKLIKIAESISFSAIIEEYGVFGNHDINIILSPETGKITVETLNPGEYTQGKGIILHSFAQAEKCKADLKRFEDFSGLKGWNEFEIFIRRHNLAVIDYNTPINNYFFTYSIL